MIKKNITPDHILTHFDYLDAFELVEIHNNYQRKTNPESPFIIYENNGEELNRYFENATPAEIIEAVSTKAYNFSADYFAKRADSTLTTFTDNDIRTTVFDYIHISQYIFDNCDPLGNDDIEKFIKFDLREEVENVIDKMDERGDLLELYNAYVDASGNGENIYYMSDFNSEMSDRFNYDEVADMASCGSFSSYDDYFIVDGGSLESFNCLGDYVEKDDIIQYVMDYSDGLGFSELEELF